MSSAGRPGVVRGLVMVGGGRLKHMLACLCVLTYVDAASLMFDLTLSSSFGNSYCWNSRE